MKTLTTKLKVEDLLAYDSIHDAIAFTDTLLPEYPKRPPKPSLGAKHTASELEIYTEQFKEYEKNDAAYQELFKAYREKQNEIHALLSDYIKELSGLNTIPEQYQEKVYALAWQEGHSIGYSEVYNYLLQLVNIFE